MKFRCSAVIFDMRWLKSKVMFVKIILYFGPFHVFTS